MSCFCGEDFPPPHPTKEKHKIFAHHDLPFPPKHFLNYRPFCVFHPTNEITNFCINQFCFMPLCPICVEEHLSKHQKDSSNSHIKTFEHVQRDSLSVIKGYLDELHSQKRNFERISGNPEVMKIQLWEDMDNCKAKVFGIVEGFFNDLKKKIEEETVRSNFMTDIHGNLQEIDLKLHELSKSMDIIAHGGQKALKQLIRLNNNKVFEESSKFIQGLSNSFHNSQTSLIHIEENLQELQNLPTVLNSYVKINLQNNIIRPQLIQSQNMPFNKTHQNPLRISAPLMGNASLMSNTPLMGALRPPQVQSFLPIPMQMNPRRSSLLQQGFRSYPNDIPIYLRQPR